MSCAIISQELVITNNVILASLEATNILIEGGIGILYAYPYDKFNSGQNVSYAIGDDKSIRDTVFNPEIATWDTALKWVVPKIDGANPALLLSGSNPNGNGTNIFGNLQRFTDENGLQIYGNNYYIDHATGMGIYLDDSVINGFTFLQSIAFGNAVNILGFTDYHWPSQLELQSFAINLQSGPNAYNYSPFNADMRATRTSTTDTGLDATTRNFLNRYRFDAIGKSAQSTSIGIAFRKAFAYNTVTKQMDLI
jgi:hypothetical protein